MIEANNPKRNSWIEYNKDSEFPIQNIPFGVGKTIENEIHCLTIIGSTLISLTKLEELNYFNETSLKHQTFNKKNLNPFLKQPKKTWREVRDCIAKLFDTNNILLKNNARDKESVLFDSSKIEMIMPVKVGDYTDFYSSKDHASNVGKMFRDPENALLPNWLNIPVGYHGRSSSIVISGTNIKRPSGLILDKLTQQPYFSNSKLLDFELEMAFITGQGKSLGKNISTTEAEDFIFGLCLFNDWSARDIQKYEYVPLGPFLGKSFASSISPWIVTLDALSPFKTDGEKQVPEVSTYLQFEGKKNYDIKLDVFLKTDKNSPIKIVSSNFKYMYWNMCQQLAHHTVNGCNINAGDMMASGTISGPNKSEFGSMLELSWGGKHYIDIGNGVKRKFIEDNDTIIMKGIAQNDTYKIGFGELKNKILK
tara:strand:+ start:19 stop:1284 length:1266 start_codon:yes stop_codon:yes gene_type:complete